MFFWRRRRDKSEDEAGESRSKRGREPDAGASESDDELEAELAADREPADFDEAAGDDGLDETVGEEDVEDLEALDEADGEDEDADDEDAEADEDDDGEPEPEDLSADLEAQAREFMADNDAWMYGENAPEVIEVLDRLEEVGPWEAEILVDLWQEITRSEREIARKGIRRVIEEDEEAERHVRLAREAIGNWVAVASDDPQHLADDEMWPRHAAQAAEAAIDAVGAIILREDLDEADFETLHGPWAAAVEAWDAEAAESEADDEAAGDDEGAEEADSGEFGPNTRLVNELLNRLWLLPQEQVSRLVSNWEQAPRDDLQQAHEALRDLVDEEPEYRRQVRRAQQQLEAWLNSGRREETSAYLGRTGTADTHSNAGPALADAVAALVVGDLLDPEDAETLYAPWFKLVGAPKLPEPAPFEDEVEEERPVKGATAKGKAAAGAKAGAKTAPGAGKGAPQSAAKAPLQASPKTGVGTAAKAAPSKVTAASAPMQSKAPAPKVGGAQAPKPLGSKPSVPPSGGQAAKPAGASAPSGQPGRSQQGKPAQPAKPYKPVQQSGPVRPGKRAASKKAGRRH